MFKSDSLPIYGTEENWNAHQGMLMLTQSQDDKLVDKIFQMSAKNVCGKIPK